MEMLLIVAALVCQPGERLIDLSAELPRGLQFMDFVVSVEPFYARLYIYQLGFISISSDSLTAFSSAAATNLPRSYACQSGTVDFASGKASHR
jgi:hypothetical protein